MTKITMADVYYATSYTQWKKTDEVYVDICKQQRFVPETPMPFFVGYYLGKLYDFDVLTKKNIAEKVKDTKSGKEYKLSLPWYLRKNGIIWTPPQNEMQEGLERFVLA